MPQKRRTMKTEFKRTALVVVVACLSTWFLMFGIYAIWRVHKISLSDAKAAAVTERFRTDFVAVDDRQLPQIEWEALRSEYPSIVAWLYCPDTKLDYPVVQGTDNNYYLTHLADNSDDRHGAIFLDYRNASDLSDSNNFIYGHSMMDGSMFSPILNWGNKDYFDAHPVVFLFTPHDTFTMLVSFAGMVDPQNPIYDLDAAQSTPLMTLSTCANDTMRFVLQGQIVKMKYSPDTVTDKIDSLASLN